MSSLVFRLFPDRNLVAMRQPRASWRTFRLPSVRDNSLYHYDFSPPAAESVRVRACSPQKGLESSVLYNNALVSGNSAVLSVYSN